MSLNDIPLFAMLRGKLGYLTERQRVVAQNVANVDTPGYTPRDLSPFSFESSLRGQMAGPATAFQKTNPRHATITLSSAPPGAAWKPQDAPDSETKLDGNQVVLEEQMMKMTEARMNYEAAIGFYQKSLGLLRMAARAPGR